MKCCVGVLFFKEEDVFLFIIILKTVFSSADVSEIDRIVNLRVGDDEFSLEGDEEELGSEDEFLQDKVNVRWV